MTGLSGFLDGEIKFIHCDFSKPRIAAQKFLIIFFEYLLILDLSIGQATLSPVQKGKRTKNFSQFIPIFYRGRFHRFSQIFFIVDTK
jgi:hypothetical protein